MNSTIKGIVGVIISILFFFPWIWLRVMHFYLHVDVSTSVVFVVGIIAAILSIVLGSQARKGGARAIGTASLTLGIISLVLNLINFVSILSSKI